MLRGTGVKYIGNDPLYRGLSGLVWAYSYRGYLVEFAGHVFDWVKEEDLEVIEEVIYDPYTDDNKTPPPEATQEVDDV